MNGNEFAGIQRGGQFSKVINWRVAAGMCVDEVDRRVMAKGCDLVAAEVVGGCP
jgi:hypothetical protein